MNDIEKKLATELLTALKNAGQMYDWSVLNNVQVRDYDYGVKVEIRAGVAEITLRDDSSGMDNFSLGILEIIANVFGSRRINIGKEEGLSSGCDTCGNGAQYELKIFVIDPVVG